MKSLLAGALLGAAVLGMPTAASAQTYDPAAQGAFAANFIYGYYTGGAFTQFDASNYATGGGCYISTGPSSSCLQTGPTSPFLGFYFTPVDGTSSGAILQANEVTFHPGGSGEVAALAFVAPTAGLYRFTGAFRASDTPNGNGVTYSLSDGSAGFLGLRPELAPFSYTQQLSAGQQAFFTVGFNGSYAFDTTGFSLSATAVPEPATWGMMILGFGAIGGAMRRRQRYARTVAALA